MSKVRMFNVHKDELRNRLVQNFVQLGWMTEEEAVSAVTTGSVPMYVKMAYWITANTDYAEVRELTPEMFNKAFGAWILYKAGVRTDTKETEE